MSRFHTYKKTDLRRAIIAAREAGIGVARIILPGGAVVEFSGLPKLAAPTANEAKPARKPEGVTGRRGVTAARRAAAG